MRSAVAQSGERGDAARSFAAPLAWERDGARWPLREASRFIAAGGVRWHVQLAGNGPPLLLVHGTGASTHSWRGLLPLLARRFTAIAPDLPGHAFSTPLAGGAPTLPAMAAALGRLLEALALAPVLALGHSAGAAILVRLCLDGTLAPRAVLGLNAALLPFAGPLGAFFSPLAKLLALNPWVPRFFAWQARSDAAVARLLASTGSRLDADGCALYARLLRSPEHVAGALAMMAAWDLAALQRDLPRLQLPLWLLVGTVDGTVPPAQAEAVARCVAQTHVVPLPGLGHLAHEENPSAVARVVYRVARRVGALTPARDAPGDGRTSPQASSR